MINIYCIGRALGAYRGQSLLKIFLEHPCIHVCYNAFGLPENPIYRKIYKFLTIIPALLYMIQADIIFVLPFEHANYLVRLCALFKKKTVVDFYISNYDTDIIDQKRFPPDSRQAEYIKNIDIRAIKNSIFVFLLTKAEALYYSSLLNIDSIEHRILPLCIPPKKPAQLNYFSNKKCINLCWTGTYIPLQGLDIILQAMFLLRGRINSHLYIWGNSDVACEPYKELISKLKIGDIVSVHNEWNNISSWEEFIVSNCDISLGIFGESSKAQTVLANKVIDGVAFKTPVITAHSAGLYDYFTGIDDVFTTNNTAGDLANTIERVAKMDFPEVKNRIENAYKIYLENFSPENFRKNIFSSFNEMLKINLL